MIVSNKALDTEYKVLMEYTTYEEFEVVIDEEGFPTAGNIWDGYEAEPRYIVKEVAKASDGHYVELDSLEVFDTYKDAIDFIAEMEQRDVKYRQQH